MLRIYNSLNSKLSTLNFKECDLHEAVLSLGLSHPKLHSATAPLAWGYKPGASTRLFIPKDKPTSRRGILRHYE